MDNLGGSARYSQVSYQYDAWGNRTDVTSYPLYGTATVAPGTSGAQTTHTTFDSLYHAYPLTSTNALGQPTTWTYNYDFGKPLTDQFEDVRIWMGKDPQYPPLPGVPLEEATSLSTDQFAQLMTGSPDQACFALRGDAFP